ncbi:type II toxin-antitoxin system RelB/DinJ family antitoxin [Pediococcus ethanolidurans]|uniref:type II toxin-antitoxin system RelB/DinJ family antitoxin n=1 Tax=Pediococcus ethanolidurans TaxID=319653 RepID=UPI002952C087|nr:type II toxin-antitoxin system RelB/DinJ family antitoxin [Pediococcus ethanolidurans]MDV7718299.1 type II toxin-antitoxin system RelB/DinJ family antitoxin [Pediococcus ethanolidurans]
MDTKQKKVTVSARIDADLKKRATTVTKNMGMDMSTAISLFLTKMVQENALPFRPEGNPLSQAISEMNAGEGKSFDSVEALMNDLNDSDQDD